MFITNGTGSLVKRILYSLGWTENPAAEITIPNTTITKRKKKKRKSIKNPHPHGFNQSG